ncbi:MAG TPA: type II secretion system minor pseudopilin GspK [Telluria sp.]|nr:type II secretion system minor pseudopilin GspK [Telluria sp.]
MNKPGRQDGVAVITALLLTTLAVSIVASLFWQQQVQVRTMENQRLQLQTKWILRGALDWATVVLRQDAYTSQWTSLDQVWATPLAETRLDQYIERERLAGESYDATLSGNITDAMSRYNLRNLAENGVPQEAEIANFKRLLQVLQLDQGLAQRVAFMVASGQPREVKPPEEGGGTPQPAGAAPVQVPAGTLPMPIMRVDDLLAVPGFKPEIVEKLRPFVVVLPARTKVNVNTAPAEVLAAMLPGGSLSEANGLVQQRKRAPWRGVSYFTAQTTHPPDDAEQVLDVKSYWFLIDSRIRLDRAALNSQALVERVQGSGLTPLSNQIVVRWVRQN